MKYILTAFIIVFLSACSSKELVKNPEMLSFSNKTMSYIYGKEFVMGTYKDFFGDKPPREVLVDNFYIDKTEVTNGAYRQYIEETGGAVTKPPYIDDLGWGIDTLPVVGVSHTDAKKFCKFYGKRLPTEAEWEFAARAGKNFQDYPWGNEENPDFMNFRDSNNSWSVDVASYPPNDFGLYDMAGNVREWVEDTYEKDFYIRACVVSPWHFRSFGEIFTDPVTNVYKSNCSLNPLNKTKSIYKVNRGGSWEYSEGYPATVSFRSFDQLYLGYKDLGFRCAANAEKSSWLRQKYDNIVDPIFESDEAMELNNLSTQEEKLNSSLMDENMRKSQEFLNIGK